MLALSDIQCVSVFRSYVRSPEAHASGGLLPLDELRWSMSVCLLRFLSGGQISPWFPVERKKTLLKPLNIRGKGYIYKQASTARF